MSLTGFVYEKETARPSEYKVSEPRVFDKLLFTVAENAATEKWMKGRFSADVAAYIALKPPQNFPDKSGTLYLAEGDILIAGSGDHVTYLYVLVPAVITGSYMTSIYEATSFLLHDNSYDSSQHFQCPTLYRLQDRTHL
jgi:hypothetical protein